MFSLSHMPSSITVAHQVWFPSLPPLQLVRKICVSIHSCLQLPPLIIFPYCTGKGPWPDICKGADAVYFCCPWRDHLTISYRDFTTEFTVKIKKKKKKEKKEGRKEAKKEGRSQGEKEGANERRQFSLVIRHLCVVIYWKSIKINKVLVKQSK